jgi:hypothetical protein
MIAAGMVALILLNAMIKLLFVKNSIKVREWVFFWLGDSNPVQKRQ